MLVHMPLYHTSSILSQPRHNNCPKSLFQICLNSVSILSHCSKIVPKSRIHERLSTIDAQLNIFFINYYRVNCAVGILSEFFQLTEMEFAFNVFKYNFLLISLQRLDGKCLEVVKVSLPTTHSDLHA